MIRTHRSHLVLVALAVAGGASLATAGCGNSPPPTFAGRAGMLSKTAISQKCEEAAHGHDRPFVVEWDATDLASFEAKAHRDTLFVHYEGCTMDVLYECNDPAIPGALGKYADPTFTSGTVQGFDIADQGDLYAKLPLGAASLSGRVEAGEKLHLKYFVSGVVQNTRDALYKSDVAKYGACANATHFVWAYNLGAFELETQEKQSAEVKAGYAGIGGGADRSHEESNLGHGGSLDSCTTQDQRACRVPIRLALRAIKDGDNPLGQAPGMTAMGGGAPGGGAPPIGTDFQSTPAGQASAALSEARRKLVAGDGAGCVTLMQRAAGLDPRQAENDGFSYTLAQCTMRAGKCDDGKKMIRQVLASRDTNHTRSDQDLDREARDISNRECPSSTATNATDLVLRASREMTDAAKAGDGAACRAKFETIYGKMQDADKEAKDARAQHQAETGQSPWNMGTMALESGAQCIAVASSCDEGLKYHKRYYSTVLRNMSNTDKTATENWQTQIKLGQVKCK